MTGFGAAEGKIGARTIRVEIRSVNHRWFNFTARLPGEYAALESEVREAVRKGLERGHLSVSIRWIDEIATQKELDWPNAQSAVEALRAIRDRFDLDGNVTVDMVVRYADLFGGRREPADVPAAVWEPLAPIVGAAVTACHDARAKEGAVLASELQMRVHSLERLAATIATLAPARLLRERERLRVQLTALMDGLSVDPQRVAQELAITADRIDITEELVRLRAHIAAVLTALRTTGPVGKQLGFLAQELGREVNTIGSKANDAEIAHEVMAMKGELEKFREQLENLE
jgi:uncharacterized protein (TIGR00255 family)